MTNHPNRNKKLIYYWDGTRRFNCTTGFKERLVIRSDGKELVMSAKRMVEMQRQERMVYG